MYVSGRFHGLEVAQLTNNARPDGSAWPEIGQGRGLWGSGKDGWGQELIYPFAKKKSNIPLSNFMVVSSTFSQRGKSCVNWVFLD
jgi:hypothetical protein